MGANIENFKLYENLQMNSELKNCIVVEAG